MGSIYTAIFSLVFVWTIEQSHLFCSYSSVVCMIWIIGIIAPVSVHMLSGAGFLQGSFRNWLHSLFLQPWPVPPIPAAKKPPHSMMLPPPRFTVGTLWANDEHQIFTTTWCLEFYPKSSIFVSSEPFSSGSYSALNAIWQTPIWLSNAFYSKCLPSIDSKWLTDGVLECSGSFSHLRRGLLQFY